MPKQIVRDVFGELLETGKATAKAGKKAASDIASQTAKTVAGHKPRSGDSSAWLERAKAKKKVGRQSKQQTEEQARGEQIQKMQEMDKKQSQQAYNQIQDQIKLIQQRRAQQPRKYVTGKADFDDEHVKDPETFFEKMKKKKEEMKNKILPWTKKKGMGTGEIRRGASG